MVQGKKKVICMVITIFCKFEVFKKPEEILSQFTKKAVLWVHKMLFCTV